MPRILVVDDDAAILDLMHALLAWLGHEVLSCRRATHAVALARDASPDLVILEPCLGRESGVGLYRQLRRDPRTAAIPVIVCSVQRDPAVSRLLGHGSPHVVAKPFRVKAFAAAVTKALLRAVAS
ncbi:MAG: response regulator [Elusimicrobia bacterium]|nr:response regulator [Elusimicrobiota bacterium]